METQNIQLDKEMQRLKILFERIGFGEVRVVIQNGKPVRIESGIKAIKLDSADEFKNGLDTIAL